MKACPYCSEQIQDAAIKCRFCQNWLVPPPPALAQMYSVYPPRPLRRTSGMAIASLVLGVLWIYWIGSILALIFGYLAKNEIREANDQIEGKGLATAGIVLGWVGVATLALMIGIIILAALMDNPQNKPAQRSISQHAQINAPLLESRITVSPVELKKSADPGAAFSFASSDREHPSVLLRHSGSPCTKTVRRTFP